MFRKLLLIAICCTCFSGICNAKYIDDETWNNIRLLHKDMEGINPANTHADITEQFVQQRMLDKYRDMSTKLAETREELEKNKIWVVVLGIICGLFTIYYVRLYFFYKKH